MRMNLKIQKSKTAKLYCILFFMEKIFYFLVFARFQFSSFPNVSCTITKEALIDNVLSTLPEGTPKKH
jgi:hypothetical protein